MYCKTEGIVLYGIKYGDTGRIVTVYTEAFGRTSFLLQGIHSKKSSGKANLLQPLFLLELEMDYRQGKELQRAREIRFRYPYQSLPFEVVKSSQAIFLAEILYKVLKEEEARPELFEFLSHSFRIFDLMREGVANFHLIFLLHLTRYMGFAPMNNYANDRTVFDMVAGAFSENKPPHPHFLEPEESRILSEIMDVSFDTMGQISISSAARTIILLNIIDYFSLHLGVRLQIKSLQILHTLFS